MVVLAKVNLLLDLAFFFLNIESATIPSVVYI